MTDDWDIVELQRLSEEAQTERAQRNLDHKVELDPFYKPVPAAKAVKPAVQRTLPLDIPRAPRQEEATTPQLSYLGILRGQRALTPYINVRC